MTEAAPIHAVLAAAMHDLRVVPKSDRNQAQNFSFRGIDSVLNAIGPILRKHQIVVVPNLLSMESETVEMGRNRTPMRSVTVTVEYKFCGPAGDYQRAIVPGEAADSGDKATSKAMSVAFRTALLQTFSLPTDEKDPDMDTFERAPAKTPLDEAKAYLWDAIKAKQLDVDDVRRLYLAENGCELKDETDAKKVRFFADRLGSHEDE